VAATNDKQFYPSLVTTGAVRYVVASVHAGVGCSLDSCRGGTGPAMVGHSVGEKGNIQGRGTKNDWRPIPTRSAWFRRGNGEDCN